MAEKPVRQNLPADLPENWTDSQYVSPGGTEVGLTRQHGFNYLMQQVNNAQRAAKELNDAFKDLATLNEEGKIPSDQLPDMNYQTKTEDLPLSSSLATGDTIPFYSVQSAKNQKITIAALKSALGVQSPMIAVTALSDTTLVCSDGTTTLNGTGTTEFSLPNTGTWTITATTGGVVVTEQVEVTGALRYTVDMRLATSIEVTTAPADVSYIVGDAINITGAVVTATFQDGTTQDITDNCDYFPTEATEGTNAITFTATLGGQEFSATTPITVDRIVISSVPSQAGSLTYNGASQSPEWSNYDSSIMTLGGTQSATTAGSYNATFTPRSRYKWSDGTTSDKTVTWKIDKAEGSSSLDVSSLSLDNSTKTGTVNVSRTGTGAVSASSSNTGVATVSVSGTRVTVTAVGSGNCTITVNVAADINYTAPASLYVEVEASMIDTTLANNTWADIKRVSDAGQGANYWSVGDGKSITIKGTVAGASLNVTMTAFILGFNHNENREGSNRIHFQLGKIGSTQVALVDGNYNSEGSSNGFRMNTTNTNSGGWNSSYARKTLLGNSGTPTSPPSGSLLAALPSDLKAVMKSVTKYTNNTGTSNKSGDVTSTVDYLFFLSEFEVQGKRTNANQYEQNYQLQYDFYRAGNSKIRYKHNATSKKCSWWSRSADRATSQWNTISDYDGDSFSEEASTSLGVAPGFCV